MDTLETVINNYLEYCNSQKCLDEKTLKAYRIDLRQFSEQISIINITEITPKILEQYIARLHEQYKPKTVKRKIASVKALFHYLEYKDILDHNPFNKILIHFRDPVILPKTIPLHTVETFLSTIYKQRKNAKTSYQKRNALRDAAVAELLFATGMRISELCSLKINDVNLYDGTILIYGKGDKERRIQIGNEAVINILTEYNDAFDTERQACNNFFINQSGKALSDQSVRRMINKYTSSLYRSAHNASYVPSHICNKPFRS
jgi:integrase/recombinase XerD